MQQKRDSIVHGVKKLAGAFQIATTGMLKVQHDEETRQSRTSLASIFEDLSTIRKSILGKGSLDNSVSFHLRLKHVRKPMESVFTNGP